MKKLPEAEFEVMKAVWESEPPITATAVMEYVGNDKGWRVQTAVTLLMRLVERGFLRTEKVGKERKFYPAITKEEYLEFETGNFLRQYHGDSISSFVSALYGDKQLSDRDVQELLKLLEERGN